MEKQQSDHARLATVTVRLRYFAGMRQAAGCDEESFSLPVQLSDRELLSAIALARPQLAAYCRVSRVAVGDQFVRGECTLSEGIEVCIIPPVSGG